MNRLVKDNAEIGEIYEIISENVQIDESVGRTAAIIMAVVAAMTGNAEASPGAKPGAPTAATASGGPEAKLTPEQIKKINKIAMQIDGKPLFDKHGNLLQKSHATDSFIQVAIRSRPRLHPHQFGDHFSQFAGDQIYAINYGC